MNKKIIIDGSNAILGRLASHVAKQALLGKEVFVINCENVVISGNKKDTLEGYKNIRAKGGSSQKGPYFPTKSSAIVKRTIRGMLSYKQGRGSIAFKKIKCYDGVPPEFEKSKTENIHKAEGMISTSLKEISEELR